MDSPQRKDHLLESPSTLYQKQKKSKQPDEVALIQEVLNSKNQGPLALINTLGLLLEFYRGHKRHEEAAEVEQQLRSLQAAMFMKSSTDTLGSPQNLIAMNYQPRFETQEVYEEDSELTTHLTTLEPEDIGSKGLLGALYLRHHHMIEPVVDSLPALSLSLYLSSLFVSIYTFFL